MMWIVIKKIFFKWMLNIPKNLINLHGDLPFLAERKKIKKMQ